MLNIKTVRILTLHPNDHISGQSGRWYQVPGITKGRLTFKGALSTHRTDHDLCHTDHRFPLYDPFRADQGRYIPDLYQVRSTWYAAHVAAWEPAQSA